MSGPNPIDDPGYFKDVLIGGRPVPGRIKDITGLESQEEWVQQMAPGINGATKIWRRRKLIEGIKIIIVLNADTEERVKTNFADYFDYIKHLKGGTSVHKKPPAFDVTSTLFKSVFVRKVVYAGHTAPFPRVGPPIECVITVDEYAKGARIPIGPPEPAKIDDSTPQPQDALAAQFQNAVAKALAAP